VNALESDPEVLWGTPVFLGTHVPAVALFDYLATGASVDEFLLDFPSVPREAVIQVLEAAGPER